MGRSRRIRGLSFCSLPMPSLFERLARPGGNAPAWAHVVTYCTGSSADMTEAIRIPDRAGSAPGFRATIPQRGA